VLKIADIPPLASSAMLEATKLARRKSTAISKDAVKCTASSGISVADLTHSSPSGSQSLSSQYCPERTNSQSGSQLGPSLSLGESSVGDSGGGSSSAPVAAKIHKGSSSGISIPVYARDEARVISFTIPSSSCISLPVQCFDLLGVELHHDSAKLIDKLFHEVRKFANKSFSHSTINYISTIVTSELSSLEKVIWFKTYKELHLSKFMCKFICMYHYRHYPNLISALDGILVSSSSSDSGPVPLSGAELLDFLSKLDCAIRKEVESIFDLEWNEVADKVFAELEDGSLGDVSCGNFINVLDVVGVPVVAFSVAQRREYLRFVVSKRKWLGRGSECEVSGTESRSLLLLKGDCDQSSSRFVKLLLYKDQPGSVSATSAVSTVVAPPEGTESSLPVTETASTTVAITTGKGVVHTSSKIKALTLKYGTSIAISSSAFAINSGVLDSLGVMLSPRSVRLIEDLFSKMDASARCTYKSMVSKQLPSDVSGKLTVTGKAIWYLTYKVMCEDSFLFKCLGKYHYKHRPSFIRSLPSIRVLSDSTDYSTAPLAGDKLLDFLSVLDGAISSKVKSIFNSCWGEVSFSLEEGGLNVVSCKDLIDVLDTAGIPQLASSALIATDAVRERNKGINKCTTSEISVIPPFVLSAMIAASTERERNKGIDDCATPETGVTGLTHSLPSSSQSLSLQSNLGLSPRAYSQSKSQLGSSLPLMEAPG
ncbi:hypothetical protein, partial [Candidatus Ichthyocystis sparus]|uniref:hypothetical protein n=1 Tax=Candidatus Ichthyocystis sparus TaxID=1561004 RepID=UPI00159EE7AB